MTAQVQEEHKVYTLCSDFVLYRGKEGEPGFFLFSLKDGRMFKLNKTSFAMLEAFDGSRTMEAVAALLASQLHADLSTVTKDIVSMVLLWQEQGIVSLGDPKQY
jgi:methyltransferase-like protein